MEPVNSLPHSQVPATCPYPEPALSRQYPHVLLPEDPSYPPIYAWVSQVVSFPQISPPEPFIRFPFSPFALHAPPIQFFSIQLLSMQLPLLPCHLDSLKGAIM